MNKYLVAFKITILDSITYRANFFVWTLSELLRFLVFPFIWLSVFGARAYLDGYSRVDIVSYYALIAFVSSVAATNLSGNIKTDIIRGNLNYFVTRPISYIGYLLSQEFSRLFFNLLISVSLYVIAAILLPQYIVVPHHLSTYILFFLLIIGSFLICFTIQLVIGFASFWLGETNSLRNFYYMLEIIFSGQLAPLAFFPIIFQKLANFLPFKFAYYFPVQVFLEKTTVEQMLSGFIYASIWIATLFCVSFILWRFGIKKYDGSGI